MPETIYTIGHSNHAIEAFVDLLRMHGITALADVRSSPYSRYCPQYNREPLQQSLKQAGMQYIYMGDTLGGRTSDPSCLKDGRVQYEALAETHPFQQGIERLVKGSESHRIVLMCAEKEPLDCHRTLLVSRELVERHIPVSHILADGILEPHEDTVTRMLAEVKLSLDDLFRGPEETISEAYRMQAHAVAYRAANESQQAV